MGVLKNLFAFTFFLISWLWLIFFCLLMNIMLLIIFVFSSSNDVLRSLQMKEATNFSGAFSSLKGVSANIWVELGVIEGFFWGTFKDLNF